MSESQPVPHRSRLVRTAKGIGLTAVAAIIAREPVKNICAVDNTPIGITSPAPHVNDNFPEFTIPGQGEVPTSRQATIIGATGATTTERAVASMRGMLEEMYGVGNVHMYNSPSSSDPEELDVMGNPVRYQQMVDELSTSLDSGRETHALAYSEGATVLARAFKMLQKQRPDLFNSGDSLKDLTVTLLSPSGFVEGVGARACYADRLLELQIAIGSAKQPNEVIESFVSFPPLNIPPDVVDKILSNVYPKLDQLRQQHDTSVQVIDFQPVRNYWDVLDDNTKQKLTQIDLQIAHLASGSDFDSIRKLAIERSEALEPYRGALYGGDYYPENEGVEKIKEAEQTPWAGRFRLVPLVWDMVTGDVVETYRQLKEHGARIVIAIPENDVHIDLDNARELIDEDEAYVIKRHVHTSLSTQPEALKPIVAPRYKKPTPDRRPLQKRQFYQHIGNR